MRTQRRFVLICSRELASEALRDVGASVGGAHRGTVGDFATVLARRGHEVEVWTVQCADEPAVEVGVTGVLVRRFRGRQEHLVPRVRPCWWVAEWVTCATSHLMTAPAGAAAVDATLVTFGAEAGVAGRLLAQRFGFDLVHIPDARQPVGGFDSRLAQEDEETCRCAAAVVPAGSDLAERFLQAMPPTRGDRPASVSLASLGVERTVESNDATARGPWLWYGAAANKYAFVGIENVI